MSRSARCASTTRSRAGSSTTPRRSGKASPLPAARPPPRPRDRSPRSASPTSARRRYCGSVRPAGRSTTRSSGRIAAPPFCASAGAMRDCPSSSMPAPALSSTPISRRQRSAGSSIRCPDWRRGPRPARSMLFDIHRLAWDEALLAAFGIPPSLLPEVRDTGADYGVTARALLGAEIPIAGVAGDQQAALIGQACFHNGMLKATYGTGAFALLNTGGEARASTHRLVTTIAYRLGGETAYALEGSIFVAGAVIGWLRDRLGLFAAAADAERLAAQAAPRQRVYLVPGFAGLGAPYWQPRATGALIGLTAECGVAEIARAALEAVGYQTRDLIAAMAADAGIAIDSLRVDGGMAASAWTMQFLADILPATVERPASVESTAWGAAYAAGLARGLCPPPPQMAAQWRPQRRFTPQMAAAEREERYAGWRRAVAGVLAAAAP